MNATPLQPSRPAVKGTWFPGHAPLTQHQTSHDLERELDLPRGWIERRTGVRRRALADADDSTSSLATAAAADAIERWRGDPQQLGVLLLATSTPDHLLPPTAPTVASKLDLNCGALDVAGACTGFLSALLLADSYHRSLRKPALVVSANILSRRLSSRDAKTRSLFADGAAAIIIDSDVAGPSPILGHHWGSDGAANDMLQVPDGGSVTPFNEHTYASERHTLQMLDGERLFRLAIRRLVASSESALSEASLSVNDIDWWVPHPGNQRLLDQARERLGIPAAKTLSTLREHGNSSAATIPLALSLAAREGYIKPGQRLLCSAVGAGLLECALVLRW